MMTADCVIVMGTSLAVAPFNMLVAMSQKADKVLINKTATDLVFDGKNELFIEGETDKVLTKLAKECGWEVKYTRSEPCRLIWREC